MTDLTAFMAAAALIAAFREQSHREHPEWGEILRAFVSITKAIGYGAFFIFFSILVDKVFA